MDRKGQDPTRGSKDAYWTTGHLWRSSGSCEKGSAERALIVCGRRDSYRHQWTASNRSRHTRGLGSHGTALEQEVADLRARVATLESQFQGRSVCMKSLLEASQRRTTIASSARVNAPYTPIRPQFRT